MSAARCFSRCDLRLSSCSRARREIASVLEDLEGLYRSAYVAAEAPWTGSVAEVLREYRAARAVYRIEAGGLRPGQVPLEEFLYRYSGTWGRSLHPPFKPPLGRPARLLPSDQDMRVRRLVMQSPLDLLAGIPAEYWTGGGFLLFLKALEKYFNLDGRIRIERVDLKAQQAERRADEREAELREERAARELEGLRRPEGSPRLISGELLPDAGDDPPEPTASAA